MSGPPKEKKPSLTNSNSAGSASKVVKSLSKDGETTYYNPLKTTTPSHSPRVSQSSSGSQSTDDEHSTLSRSPPSSEDAKNRSQTFKHGELYLTVVIEDYAKLKTPQSFTDYYDSRMTAHELLVKIANKHKVALDHSLINQYGLFKTKATLKKKKDPSLREYFPGKELKGHKTLKQQKLQSNDLLMLRRTTVEEITLNILIEGYEDLNCPFQTVETFPVLATIQDVIDRIAKKSSVMINPEEQDSCALFLPTAKSKKGVLMEPTKTIKSFRLHNREALIFKHRKKEELILGIEIEPYHELNCVRILNCMFNINLTVKEALLKIARKGNVFIEDTSKYQLCLASREKMDPNETLASFKLNNRDTLILQKREGFFTPLWRKAKMENVILLCETNDFSASNNEKILKFASDDHEQLYWSLSWNSHGEESEPPSQVFPDFPDTMPDWDTPVDEQPTMTPMSQLSPEQKDQITQSLKSQSALPVKSTLSRSLSSIVLPKMPPPEGLPRRRADVNRPGAIPRKQASDSLSLVSIYHTESKYWTLAVNNKCTVKDICSAIEEIIKTPVALYEVESENGELNPIRRLHATDSVLQVKSNWPQPSSLKFYVQNLSNNMFDTPRSLSYSSNIPNQAFREQMEKWEKTPIPDNVRLSTDIKDLHLLQNAAPEFTDADLNLVEQERTKKQKKAKQTKAIVINGELNDQEGDEDEDDGENSELSLNSIARAFRRTKTQWINVSELTKERKLGKGGFSKVYLGMYKDSQVAIKTLLGMNEQQIGAFKAEMEILSSVTSEHLVKFFGACIEVEKLSLVMEYCPNGSLYSHLNKTELTCTWDKVLKWLLQTLKGISALHSNNPPLVHRDIKSINLLLDAEFNIKVCDFGLTRFRTFQYATTLGELRGTMAFCPPEIYDGHLFSDKSDIYSIGMVLWEMVTRTITGVYNTPFDEFPEISYDFQIIIQSSKHRLRPTILPQTPKQLKTLIEQLWHGNPDNRPTCLEVLEVTEKLIEQNSKEPWEIVKAAPLTRMQSQEVLFQ